jgi:hypothetical protein
MKISEAIDGARLRLGAWNRERREKAEERKAARALPEYGFDRTPRRIRFAVMLATWGVIGFLILWVIQITGNLQLDVDLRTETGQPWGFDYDFQARLNVFPLAVLTVVSFAIVFWTKAWVSAFAATPWREWFSKCGIALIGIGGSVAIIMGGFEVNQNTRQEDFRGALVEEQAATQARAALEAQVQSIDARLVAMRDQSRVGVYAAIAASVGAAAYDSDYLSEEALARSPPERRDIIRRARGSAVAADNLEAQRQQLIGQIAAATPVAATQAVVEMQDPVSRFIRSIGQWRIVILVVVGDLLLLLGTYFADKHEERNRYARSTQASGWAPEERRIEDKRAEEPIASNPVKVQTQVRATNAETGEEEILVKPRPYWRRARRGVPTPVEVNPDIPPDETGVPHDGGGRAASERDHQQNAERNDDAAAVVHEEAPGAAESNAAVADNGAASDEDQAGQPEQHTEPFSLTEADELALADFAEPPEEPAEPAIPVEAPADASESQERGVNERESEPVVHHELQDEREPETRPERLIASVAAE